MSNLLKSKFLLGVMTVAIMFVGVVAVSDTASAATCTITMTLKVGSKGVEVQCLQTALGVNADGSFGPATKAAVMAFQTGKGLVADGVFGSVSRSAWMGSSVAGSASGSFPAGCTSSNGFSITTGLSCSVVATNFPAGCTSSNGFSTTTGLSCSVVTTNFPAGCSSTSGFSSTTGAKCDGVATPVTAGGEGSVAVTYDPIPANNLAVNRGETKEVMAVKVKATGSDMKVSRVWLDINTRIWLSAESVSLMDGSIVLATLPLSSSTVTETTVGSAWQLQFNGLNVVVPKDTTKVLTFKVKRPTLTNANASVTIAATSTLRATDVAGISSTYTLSARDWNMANVAASAGTLSASLSGSSPVIQSVSGLSATVGTLTNVKLMDFDLKATDGPINVSLISGTLTAAGTCTAAQCASSTELRDGTTVLASVTGANVFSFASLNIDIPTGTTKKLSIWVKANHIASSFVVKGDSLLATVSVVTATTGADFTNAAITPTVAGNAQTLFRYAPTFALNTAGTTVAQVEGTTTGKKALNAALSFTVTAPSDSDIYVNGTDGLICGGTYPITKIGNAACSSTTIGGTMSAATVTVSGASSKGTGTLSTWDKVSMGQTRTFTLEGYIPDGNAAGMTGMTMNTNGLQWTDTDNITISGAASTEQTWGLTDFKTGTKYVTS